MKRTLALIGAGAGLMYFFDPELGEIRRSVLRDKLTGVMPKTQEAIDAKTQNLTHAAADLTHRADDVAAEVVNTVGDELKNAAQKATEKVAQKVGHAKDAAPDDAADSADSAKKPA